MSHDAKLFKVISLASSKSGIITLSHVNEPYGAGSHSVVSIGISLKGDESNPEWRTHIPYENIDELIEGLKEAKERFG